MCKGKKTDRKRGVKERESVKKQMHFAFFTLEPCDTTILRASNNDERWKKREFTSF